MNEEISKYLSELDVFQITISFFSVFMIGGLLSYWIWGDPNENIFQSIWSFLNRYPVEDARSFLSLSAKILGTLVGIALPISISIISNNFKNYKDKWVANLLLKEFAFKAQIHFTLPLVAIILGILFFDLTSPLVLVITFFLVLLSLYFFYLYLKLIVRYAIATDDIVLEKAKKQIDEILE